MTDLWAGAPIDSEDVHANIGEEVPSTAGETIGPELRGLVGAQTMRAGAALSAQMPAIPESTTGWGSAAAQFGTPRQAQGAPPLSSAPEPTLSAADATRQYGIPGALVFDSPVPASVAQMRNQATQDRLTLQDSLARQGSGFWNSIKFAGANLVANVLDPLNTAAAFVPVIGEDRFAAWMGESFLGRTAARAATWGAQGAVGQAALSGLRYGLSQGEQADYSAGDALRDIAGGALFGAGLGAAGGALADLVGGRFRASAEGAAVREDPTIGDAAARTAIGQVVEDNPVEVDPVVAAGMRAQGIVGDNAGAPMSLTQFLISRGGVQDQGGDLEAMDARIARPGLVRNEGMTLDHAREIAVEDGRLAPDATISDLLDSVRQDISGGQRVYREGEAPSGLTASEARQQGEYDRARVDIAAAAREAGVPLGEDEAHQAAIMVVGGVHPDEALTDTLRAADEAHAERFARAMAAAAHQPTDEEFDVLGHAEDAVAGREPRVAGAGPRPQAAGRAPVEPIGRTERPAAETGAPAGLVEPGAPMSPDERFLEEARAKGLLGPEEEAELTATHGMLAKAVAAAGAFLRAATCLGGGG